MQKSDLNKIRLDFKRFGFTESIILIVFLIIVLLWQLSNYVTISFIETEKNKQTYEGIIDFVILFGFGFSAMSILFRNSAFAIIWIVLGILYATADMHLPTHFPVIEILTFYIARFIFLKIYKREFIACYLGKGTSRPYFSYLDNRESTDQDAVFTWILFFTNFFIMLFTMMK